MNRGTCTLGDRDYPFALYDNTLEECQQLAKEMGAGHRWETDTGVLADLDIIDSGTLTFSDLDTVEWNTAEPWMGIPEGGTDILDIAEEPWIDYVVTLEEEGTIELSDDGTEAYITFSEGPSSIIFDDTNVTLAPGDCQPGDLLQYHEGVLQCRPQGDFTVDMETYNVASEVAIWSILIGISLLAAGSAALRKYLKPDDSEDMRFTCGLIIVIGAIIASTVSAAMAGTWPLLRPFIGMMWIFVALAGCTALLYTPIKARLSK